MQANSRTHQLPVFHSQSKTTADNTTESHKIQLTNVRVDKTPLEISNSGQWKSATYGEISSYLPTTDLHEIHART